MFRAFENRQKHVQIHFTTNTSVIFFTCQYRRSWYIFFFPNLFRSLDDLVVHSSNIHKTDSYSRYWKQPGRNSKLYQISLVFCTLIIHPQSKNPVEKTASVNNPVLEIKGRRTQLKTIKSISEELAITLSPIRSDTTWVGWS